MTANSVSSRRAECCQGQAGIRHLSLPSSLQRKPLWLPRGLGPCGLVGTDERRDFCL